MNLFEKAGAPITESPSRSIFRSVRLGGVDDRAFVIPTVIYDRDRRKEAEPYFYIISDAPPGPQRSQPIEFPRMWPLKVRAWLWRRKLPLVRSR